MLYEKLTVKSNKSDFGHFNNLYVTSDAMMIGFRNFIVFLFFKCFFSLSTFFVWSVFEFFWVKRYYSLFLPRLLYHLTHKSHIIANATEKKNNNNNIMYSTVEHCRRISKQTTREEYHSVIWNSFHIFDQRQLNAIFYQNEINDLLPIWTLQIWFHSMHPSDGKSEWTTQKLHHSNTFI